jgi:hypothetical protein
MKKQRLATVIAVVGLVLGVLAGPVHAALEDILYEKGTITKEEWLKAKADAEKAMGPVEKLSEWQKKVAALPILSDKFNIGVNVLQVQYLNNEADATPGTSDNRFFIRRAELITWGKVNDYWPRWHMLFDFAALSNIGRSSGLNSISTTGTATDNHQILREAYVDIVPSLTAQPYIDRFRIGQYRIPVGIEGSTSSGLIDFVNRNYITQAPGASTGGFTGTAAAGTFGGGTIDFVRERDVYVNLMSKPLEQLELDLGIMNGNGINGPGTSFDNNSQKDFFGRARVKPRKDLFMSFSTIQGESTNLNSRNGGHGKGNYDRYIADFQWKPAALPGFWLQGEYAWGHDAPPVNAADNFAAGARGELRKAWYVYAKYLIQSGPLKDWELLGRYEQFDPSTNVSQDKMERTTVGINYYFANLPPKIQAKFMINYEFRHRDGFGPGTSVNKFDEFGNDALLLQLHVRWF